MSSINSILAVDFGSVHTRLVLIDVVDGSYRMISRAETRTTNGFPANDILVGLDRVLKEVTDVTGRRIVADGGRIVTPEQANGSGVDLFAVTASVGRPLRAVVVGVMPDLSIASAVRAISTNYINVAATISLYDGRTEEERVNKIVLAYPDVVVITGGIEQGARSVVRNLARITALGVSLIERNRRPSVIFTGNSEIQEDITAIFEGIAPVLIAENVRPDLDEERLDSARLQLGQAYDNYAEQQGESFLQISGMSQTGVLPSAQGYGVLAEYLSRTGVDPVALVDVGSASSTLAIAVNGAVQTRISTDIGLGHSAENLLETVGADAIRYWLPFNISRRELLAYVTNKALTPATVPATLRDLYLEHAMLKAGIRHLLMGANPDWEFATLPFKHLIGAGGALTGTGHPAYDVLLLLDAFQPDGVTIIDADPYGLVSAMGAVASHNPEAVVQLIEGRNLRRLAIVVSADGRVRRNRQAFKVTLRSDDGEVIEEKVQGGNLWRYTLPPGRRAEVTIKGSRGTSVNGKRSVKLTLGGELAGLIIDARGRPLSTGKNVAERAELLPLWVSQLTEDPLQEIDPAWLEAVEEDKKPVVAEEKSEKRRKDKSEKRRRRRKDRQEEAASDETLEAMLGLGGLEMDDDGDTGGDDPGVEDELDELRNVLS